MKAGGSSGGSSKPKNLVKIRWVSGQVAITPVGEGEGDLTITRLPPGQTQSCVNSSHPYNGSSPRDLRENEKISTFDFGKLQSKCIKTST